MQKLIHVENIKTFSSNTFRVILTLHFLFYILVVLAVSRIELSMGEFYIGRLYEFPNVWEFFSWVASWFNILLGVLVIVLICNEFRFYTFRRQIMNGLNEGHLLLGKIYMIIVIALYALLLVIVSSLVSGNIAGSEPLGLSQFAGMQVVLVYFLQALAYMSMAMLFAILFKNNGLAIVIFILYLFPGEVILRNLIFTNIQEYFPAKLISGLTPLPVMFRDQADSLKTMGMEFGTTQAAETALITPHEVGIAIVYIVVFLSITYWVLKRKNY
ncbi:MAG: ABC transporter permease [Bacteroidota bacterium]